MPKANPWSSAFLCHSVLQALSDTCDNWNSTPSTTSLRLPSCTRATPVYSFTKELSKHLRRAKCQCPQQICFCREGRQNPGRWGSAVECQGRGEHRTLSRVPKGGPPRGSLCCPSLPVSPSSSRLRVCPRAQGEPVTAVDG